MPTLPPITRPGELPMRYQIIWHECANKYVSSRLFATTEAARDAAFDDVRTMYWNDLKAQYARDRAKA